MKIDKRTLIIIVLSVFLLLLLLYIFVLSQYEETMTVLSHFFTAVGGISAIVAIIIAVQLYEKFKLDYKFLYRKSKEVIKLHKYLTQTSIKISADKGTFFLKSTALYFLVENPESVFKEALYKEITIYDKNYAEWIQPILKINDSIWLPDEIKTALKFLICYGFDSIGDNINDYAVLKFGNVLKDSEQLVILPKTTLKEFVTKYVSLANCVDNWFKKNTSVKINVRLYYEF